MKFHNYFIITLSGLLFLMLSQIASAQNVTISGTVTGGDNAEPLPGVTIQPLGTNSGTITDLDGRYSISVSNNATLKFSFVGYLNKLIEVGSQSTINVEMELDTETLEEIVVIGYGTTTKQKLTGAVTSVTPESFKSGPITTLAEALQGNAAGLMIQNNGGQPGADARINIRGINSLTGGTQPLIVLDGFPLFDVNTSGGGGLESFSSQMSPLAFINPADIKSIEILKDASATAIYGNRGANGVIIITTNRGGQAGTKVTYSNFFGVRKLSKKLDVLNLEEYAKYQSQINPGNRLFFNQVTGGVYDFNYDRIPDLNWQDELYRTGFVQNHSLSIQNSTEKSNTFFSLATLNDKSILSGTNFTKYNAKLGFEQNQSKKFTFGGDLNFNYIENEGVPTEGRNGTATGATINALTARPFDLRDPATYAGFLEVGVPQVDLDNTLQFDFGNPIVQARDTDMKKSSSRFIANSFINYEIADGLSLRLSGAVDVYNLKARQWYPKTTGLGQLFDGLAIISNVQSINVLNENILNYKKRFNGVHDLNLTTGLTIQGNNYENILAENSSFENELLGYNQVGNASQYVNFSDVNRVRYLSYIFRAIYTYDEKLNISISARRDGTSRFLDNKWGNFYSAGLSYDVISDFKALSSLFENLKLRLSIGQVGNADVPLTGAFAQTRTTNYTFDDGLVLGVSPANLANEGLTWEVTTEINSGVDFSIGDKGKLSGSIDYYVKETNDLILETVIPNISGFSRAFINVGTVRGSGLELSLRSDILTSSNFSWNLGGNFTHVTGKIVALGPNEERQFVNPFIDGSHTQSFILRVGGKIGEIYGYKSDGVYTIDDFDGEGNYIGEINPSYTPRLGDLKLQDLNQDGIINDQDRTVLGTSMPKFYGGLTNTLKYRNFDLVVMMQYFFGNSIFNATKTRTSRFIGGADNVSSDYLNRYNSENTNTTQYAQIPQTLIVDKYVEDGAFLRISNLKMGYTIPANLLALNAKSLNVYVSIDNLWVFTKYSGYDPEVSTNHSDNSKSSALSSGIDYGSFPRSRTYMAGLTLTF